MELIERGTPTPRARRQSPDHHGNRRQAYSVVHQERKTGVTRMPRLLFIRSKCALDLASAKEADSSK